MLVTSACVPISARETLSPAPAEFETVSLDIQPPEGIAGSPAIITATVRNIGGSEGAYTAILTVDGATVDTKDVVIAAGSSATVTFILAKDLAGDYEVGIGGLSSSLTIQKRLVTKEIELKYDDGRARDYLAAAQCAYVVDFEPPAVPFIVKKVRNYGMLCGSATKSRYSASYATVSIWADEQPLHRSLCQFIEFPLAPDPAWVEVEIPNVEITSNKFFVAFYSGNAPRRGVHIGADDSVLNRHSDHWFLNMLTRHFEMQSEWPYPRDRWFGDKNMVNWIIRVIRTYVTPAY